MVPYDLSKATGELFFWPKFHDPKPQRSHKMPVAFLERIAFALLTFKFSVTHSPAFHV
jgi:hypothetical protein